ncbi:MAG: GlsB/YeaQ/YmgE family stress response membrane protein [Ornithinibacter sp.]
MLILGIILFGMIVGAAAQLILRRGTSGINWPMAFATGIIGSLVGGLLVSLLSGDGLDLRPSGIIGSIIGAILCVLAWEWFQGRKSTNA